MQRRLLLISVACLLCAKAGAQVNLLTNGDFETPQYGATFNFSGSQSLTGWDAFSTGGSGNAGVVVGTNFGLSPQSGTQSFSFNGNDPAAGTWIEQTFNTSIGTTYDVTFYLGRNNGNFGTLRVNAQAFDSGSTELAASFLSAPSSVIWEAHSFQFTATSTASRLRFTDASGSNPNSDLFLDTVAVTAIPEPSAAGAMLAVAALVITARRRRK